MQSAMKTLRYSAKMLLATTPGCAVKLVGSMPCAVRGLASPVGVPGAVGRRTGPRSASSRPSAASSHWYLELSYGCGERLGSRHCQSSGL
jgi:hypothetical protein